MHTVNFHFHQASIQCLFHSSIVAMLLLYIPAMHPNWKYLNKLQLLQISKICMKFILQNVLLSMFCMNLTFSLPEEIVSFYSIFCPKLGYVPWRLSKFSSVFQTCYSLRKIVQWLCFLSSYFKALWNIQSFV